MVFLVRWMTMRETERIRKEVMDRYDQALKQVSDLSNVIKSIPSPKFPEIPHIPTVAEIVAAIPPVTVPEAELARIRESVTGALNGAVGSYSKKLKAGIEDEDDVDPIQTIMQSMLRKLTK
jgi:hypothetical protein